MASIRVWRQSERKDMIDAIDELISQARRAAKSQYTRSAKKAQWTRLAGQLIWYKDQILRAMTYEALEADVHMLMRKVFEDTQPSALSYLRQPSPDKSLPAPADNKFWEKKIGPKPGDPEDSSATAAGQSR